MTISRILPTELWARLEEEPFVSLIDVRHMNETCAVGWPDLTKHDLDVPVVTVESIYAKPPTHSTDLTDDESLRQPHLDEADQRFLRGLKAETNPEHEVWFISRNEGRAQRAAAIAHANGWQRVGIVTGGFEGPLDPNGQRSSLAGWRVAGLPWQQR